MNSITWTDIFDRRNTREPRPCAGYHYLLKTFCNNTLTVDAFTLGHIAGQAEKVKMGACRGMLVCWSQHCAVKVIKDLVWLSEVVAAAYDLEITPMGNELAIHQAGFPPDWLKIKDPKEVNRLRGLFTGVPAHLIDDNFGYRGFEVSDQVKERINGLVERGRSQLDTLGEIDRKVSPQQCQV